MEGLRIAVAMLFLVTLAACQAPTFTSPQPAPMPGVEVEMHVDYVTLSTEEAIRQASAIVIGPVEHISASRWNQDSGEYWDDSGSAMSSLLYYEATLVVEASIRGGYQPGEKITLTILGNSPDESFLQTAERVLVMLEKRAIAWRTVPRERVVVVGGPQGKYHLTQDGQALNAADPRRSMALEQLLAQIASASTPKDKQTITLQPPRATTPTAVALETETLAASTDDLSAGQPPIASEHGVDCGDQAPGLPDTLQIITADGAQLAFVTRGGGVALLNLTTGQTRTFSQTLSFAGWSPSGQHLLLGYSEFRYRGNFVVPRQTFWAPPEALPGATDWLALTMADGALLAVSVPGGQCYRVLPPGSLGEGGVGSILWSADGWLAWTGGLDHLAQTETWTQTLYRRPVAGTEVVTRSLSSDIRETYYQLIAWVPGRRLILAAEGMLANSLWSWGVPLVTINFTECPL
jgi:hypothetical protein